MDIRSTLFCSLLAVATIAHAEGFYVLGSAGQTRTNLKDFSRTDLDFFIESQGDTVQTSKIDQNDTGYKLQLGYQFAPNFAIEGGYVNLGSIAYKYTVPNGDTDANGNPLYDGKKLSYDTKGWNIDGVLILPVNAGVSVFGKLGLIRAETKFKGTDYGSYTNTKVAPLFGAGIAWNFYQGLSVRAEWERYFNLNQKKTITADTGEFEQFDSRLNVDLFSVGVSYQF